MILDHRLAERHNESGATGPAIGTTGRGIGPAYTDKAARVGPPRRGPAGPRHPRRARASARERTIRLVGKDVPVEPIETVLARLERDAERLRPMVVNVSLAIAEAVAARKRILLEGAQGTHLDLDHGTYPYVTSSSAGRRRRLHGRRHRPHADRGSDRRREGLRRVGNGLFPFELSGGAGRPPAGGRGNEYGATTGRPRRCGWFDAVAIRHAVRVNGLTQIVIHEARRARRAGGDRGRDRIHRGRPPRHGDARVARRADRGRSNHRDVPRMAEADRRGAPVGRPSAEARRYLDRLEGMAGVPIRLVSVGSGRDENVRRHANLRSTETVGL